jgi:uncharacterized protein YfaS (alpha-2-macroglobulin family)
MLYRPMDEKAKRMPSRALGLRWLAVDQAPRMLNVKLEAPEKVKSGAMLTVPVKVTGLAQGEEARITVAATDLGILNLTRFETPAAGLVFGQRRPRHRDPRRLRPPHRRHARRARHVALGGDGSDGMAMKGSRRSGDARAVLRHRQSRLTAPPGRVPDARLQRYRSAQRRGVDCRQARLR